ncbi:hypothetical protein [Streptomyces sp. NPDC049915]|uniref:hypothetical protein n=1 Tax=Streptomyces sp. NPDC049915 TaxID=3155510 RepID=UPI003424CC41
MHRTTTTATLLVTVAISALSGCVTVQRPPASGPPVSSTRSPSPSVPRQDGATEQRIVRAPAREALERVGPSRHSEPVKPPQPRRPAHAEPPAPGPQDRHQQTPLHASPPEHRRPQDRRAKVPDVPADVARRNAEVCALGAQYGGWRPDSPEARICKQTYGR